MKFFGVRSLSKLGDIVAYIVLYIYCSLLYRSIVLENCVQHNIGNTGSKQKSKEKS